MTGFTKILAAAAAGAGAAELGIGMPEVDKVTGEQVVDKKGRPRIALTGAGRTNTQAIITYVRRKSGLDLILDADDLADAA